MTSTTKALSSTWVVRVASWLAIPTVAVASIWLPILAHYRLPGVEIDSLAIEEARRRPEDSVLREVRGDRLLFHGFTSTEQLVSAAEALLHGELRLVGYPAVKFHLPFRETNLLSGSSSMQLLQAGLVPTDVLLEAYELTGKEEFFSAARASVLGFAEYERRTRLPRGMLWNDHAIANRIFVLSDFWRTYRAHPSFEASAAQAILRLVDRSGEFLAAPGHFTYATNHGVMQNIGLLRLALTFPSLPSAARAQRLAVERLGEQVPFFVGEDGAVLEHSADYQVFGVQLLTRVRRYMRLLRVPVPADWERRYARAVELATLLRRPDGSLPLFGDTVWRAGKAAKLAVPPLRPVMWYPVGGYALWWDGLERWPDSKDLRQTVVAFSFFPGHAHKHADDLSVLLWAGGQSWWTNVGYWPYGHPKRPRAESWDGSNAPHLIDEPKDSQRRPILIAFGASNRTLVVDVARGGPGTYRARRQVIHLRPNTWLILDHISGVPKRFSTTRWSTGHGIDLRQGRQDGEFILETGDGSRRLFASFFSSPGMSLQIMPRVLGPFLRHSSPNASAEPVSAILVTQRADDSWAAVVWIFDDGTLDIPAISSRMTRWRGAEEWSVVLPGSPALEIDRQGNRLNVRAGAFVDSILLETPAPDAARHREEAIGAFETLASKYPQFRARLNYRFLSTYILVAGLAGQEVFLSAIARRNRRMYNRLRLFSALLWIVGGVSLFVVFSGA